MREPKWFWPSVVFAINTRSLSYHGCHRHQKCHDWNLKYRNQFHLWKNLSSWTSWDLNLLVLPRYQSRLSLSFSSRPFFCLISRAAKKSSHSFSDGARYSQNNRNNVANETASMYENHALMKRNILGKQMDRNAMIEQYGITRHIFMILNNS